MDTYPHGKTENKTLKHQIEPQITTSPSRFSTLANFLQTSDYHFTSSKQHQPWEETLTKSLFSLCQHFQVLLVPLKRKQKSLQYFYFTSCHLCPLLLKPTAHGYTPPSTRGLEEAAKQFKELRILILTVWATASRKGAA